MRHALSLALGTIYGRSTAGAAVPPDAANLQVLATSAGPFFQDSARTIPAVAGDLVGSWSDTLAGLRHFAGSGTTRPIRRVGGLSFAEDGVSDWLVSAASALATGWSVYVRCDVTSIADGILVASSPTTAAEPLVNTYATQLYASTNTGFQALVADAGGNTVRGMAFNGTLITAFVGSVETSAAATSQAIAALSVGATTPGYYKGLIQAIALYRGGHDLATRSAVRAYLATL